MSTQSANLKAPGSIVITGGCGFLGGHLAERFAAQGRNVVCIDNFSTALRSNAEHLVQNPRIKILEADVVEKKTWDKVKDFDKQFAAVLHFASPASPPHYQRMALETMAVNSIGTQNALEFADAYNARVVFASTSEIYGDPDVHPQPESYWGNVNTVGIRSCYDESKRFGESLIHTWNWKKNTKHGFVRIFNTYGPRMNPDDGRVVINFLEQALRKKPLTVYGNGLQTRSFCYVDDLVEAIYRYTCSELVEPVNIGNEKEFTMLELAKVVQNMFSQNTIAIEFSPLPKDDPKQRRPDLSKARQLLSWEPQISLREGLEKMSVWLKSYLNLS